MDQEYDSNGRPARRKTGWTVWAVLGCGCLIVLIAGFAGGLVYMIKGVTDEPVKAVRAFLTAAGAGDTVTAFSYFSAPLKETQPYPRFVAEVKVHPSLFQVKDTTFTSRRLDTNGARLSGTLTLTSGTRMPASFRLVRENGAWKLLSYHIGDD